MFDISFSELLVFGTVALLVLGPDKLPEALRTAGQWVARARKLVTHLQEQSGLSTLPTQDMLRGALSQDPLWSQRRSADVFVPDIDREYPVEGPDHYGALPEDLVAIDGADTETPLQRADQLARGSTEREDRNAGQ